MKLEVRWSKHKYDAKYKNERFSYLHKSMKKYGFNNFYIEQIDSAKTQKELNEKEKYWANEYNSYRPGGYNLDECGNEIGRNRNKLIIDNQSKTYELVSPNGRIIKIFNLASFCKDNNLDKYHMYKVANGTRKQHKGWSKNEPLEIVTVKSPEGKLYDILIHYGSTTEFCKKHNLEFNNFFQLVNKYKTNNGYQRKSSKGWTLVSRKLQEIK